MICPSCDTPNPDGARRCVCGYVFQFDAPAAMDGGPRARSAGATAGLVGAFLVATAAAAIFVSHHLNGAPEGPWLPLFLIAAGLFAGAGAALDWEFFMTNRRARIFVALLGRTGARWFYALLGGALAGVGLGFLH